MGERFIMVLRQKYVAICDVGFCNTIFAHSESMLASLVSIIVDVVLQILSSRQSAVSIFIDIITNRLFRKNYLQIVLFLHRYPSSFFRIRFLDVKWRNRTACNDVVYYMRWVGHSWKGYVMPQIEFFFFFLVLPLNGTLESSFREPNLTIIHAIKTTNAINKNVCTTILNKLHITETIDNHEPPFIVFHFARIIITKYCRSFNGITSNPAALTKKCISYYCLRI